MRLPKKNSRHEYDSGLKARYHASCLIGVDEAGRGPLAGPVLVAAVILPEQAYQALRGVRDSKKLSAGRREFFFDLIRQNAVAVSVAWAHPVVIDRVNILAATLSSMKRAVERLRRPGLVAVDGNRKIPCLSLPQITVVGGDDLSLSIACASIVAKVLRDRWMLRQDRRCPGYGLAGHKGYGTKAHKEALSRLGPSPLHRRSFAPCREVLR